MKIEFDPANPGEVAAVRQLIDGAVAQAQPVAAPPVQQAQPVQQFQPQPVQQFQPQMQGQPGAPMAGQAAPMQQAGATQADMGAAIQKLATAKGPKTAKALLGQMGYASTASVPPEAYGQVIAAVEQTLAAAG